MRNSDPKFHALRYTQIATGHGRELALKEEPAVYAWYRNLSLGDAVGSRERFLARIEAMLSSKLSLQCSGKLGYLYDLSVQEHGGPLSPRSRVTLEAIADSGDARHRLASLLELATFLQSPLYIGKTRNLRNRIAEHVSGASGLRRQLETANISMSLCVLRFRYIDEIDVQTMATRVKIKHADTLDRVDAVVLLIEELLTRLSPSAFVRRPG